MEENSQNKPQIKRKRRSRYLTGEDIDMLRENNSERSKRQRNICDYHEDGA